MQRIPAATPQLQDFLAETARRTPDRVALVCDHRRLTYAEIERASNSLARALADRGVERGDRVVVFAENSVETVIAFWAALKANAIVCILHSQIRAEKLAGILADCEPAALIADARHAAILATLLEVPASLRTVVVAGVAGAAGLAHPPVWTGWDQVLASAPDDSPPPRFNLDLDVAAIIYTSGSTGDPKGIMLTHRNMISAATSISAYLEHTADDVILDVLPLSFTYGLYQLITAFQCGARLVLERSFAYPEQMLRTMVVEGVTGLAGVPTMYARLAERKTLRDHDLSKLRYLTNAAAALPVKHLLRMRELLPHVRFYSMYGQTECARGTYLPPEDVERKPDSIGIAIPNTEAWVVDERDRRLGPNQVGQLVIRGAHVMKGYWRKPEATEERLRPGPLPGERVLYTGDLCRIDEEGYVYFVSRMDDVIKSRGEKVAPREVEKTLLAIPGVREAAVIGVPDEILGQAVKAFVVLEAGAALTEKAIQIECQKHLEPFMVPSQVAFVPDLPRTPSGKILKGELAKGFPAT